MNGRGQGGVPLEDFIQALSSQLDRVQSGMALKVKAGLPLTFAVKDLTLDLKAHVDVDGPVVRIRSATPGDGDASTIRLAMTTITRPLMEENTPTVAADPSDTSLHEALADELSPDDLRRLEWAGVQTVAQLRRLQESAGESAIGRIANVPALRLRAALARASEPAIHDIQIDGGDGAWRPGVAGPPAGQQPMPDVAVPPIALDPGPHIRVAGRNFLRDGPPEVRLGDQRLEVVSSSPREIVARAPSDRLLSGMLEIETPAGRRLRHPLPERRS